MTWPQDEAARLLDLWARLPTGPAKALAEDAFLTHRRRLAELLETCLRALAAEGGPGDTLRAVLGDDIAAGLRDRFDLWQKVADAMVRKVERTDREYRRLRSEFDTYRAATDERLRRLEQQAPPTLKVVPG